MYLITIEGSIGDLVKDSNGKIYEIHEINVSISIGENGKENISLSFDTIDITDSWMIIKTFNANEVEKPTEQEIDEYLSQEPDNELNFLFDNNNQENSGTESNNKEEIKFESIHEEMSYTVNKHLDDIFSPNKNHFKQDIEKNHKERTVDDILDEYLDYSLLKRMFGDEDKRYENIIDLLKLEFRGLSK